MANNQLTGEIVREYLDKWPDLPSRTLARLIYNKDDNHKLFRHIDHIRDIIRYYRGMHGVKSRKGLKTKDYVRSPTIVR